jgi:hypothetical protein
VLFMKGRYSEVNSRERRIARCPPLLPASELAAISLSEPGGGATLGGGCTSEGGGTLGGGGASESLSPIEYDRALEGSACAPSLGPLVESSSFTACSAMGETADSGESEGGGGAGAAAAGGFTDGGGGGFRAAVRVVVVVVVMAVRVLAGATRGVVFAAAGGTMSGAAGLAAAGAF